MCTYEGFKYTCGHTIYERRSTCWGWFWEKLHFIDCCYALVTCTGGMPPACETDTYITEMDRKCFKCHEEEIEEQRKKPREYQYPEGGVSALTNADRTLSEYTMGNYVWDDPPRVQAQQGMQYPQDPPAAGSQYQTPLPSPAVRESFNRRQSQNLGTKVMSPGQFVVQDMAYHRNLTQSSTGDESRSRRRHASQGPSSAPPQSQHFRSERSRSRPRDGNRRESTSQDQRSRTQNQNGNRPSSSRESGSGGQRSRSQPRDGSRRESTSQDQRPCTEHQNGSRPPLSRESRSGGQRSHSQQRDSSRSRGRRESTSRGERPPLSTRGRSTYYNDPTPVR